MNNDGLSQALQDCQDIYDSAAWSHYLADLDRDPEKVADRFKEVLMSERVFEKWEAAQDAYLADLETLIQVYKQGEFKQAWEMLPGIERLERAYLQARGAWEAAEARLSPAELKPFDRAVGARAVRFHSVVSQVDRIRRLLEVSDPLSRRVKR